MAGAAGIVTGGSRVIPVRLTDCLRSSEIKRGELVKQGACWIRHNSKQDPKIRRYPARIGLISRKPEPGCYLFPVPGRRTGIPVSGLTLSDYILIISRVKGR